MKQEEFHLKLEAEMAKTSTKERAFAAMTTTFLPQLQPVKLELRFNNQDSAVPSRTARTIQEEVPFSEQSDPCNSILRGPHSLSAPKASEDLRRETIEFQRQQNTFQLQQNRIVELLALNRNRGKLPQLRVPTFDGNPNGYRTFARAYENLIEFRTSSSTDRLYFLEHFIAGDF